MLNFVENLLENERGQENKNFEIINQFIFIIK
jgi:hypothetical protein